MQVNGLNHVNIVAADMDRTVEFFETVLGLQSAAIPFATAGSRGRWMHDQRGQPIVHLQAFDPERHGQRGADRENTGPIDHVALTCDDFEGMVQRCKDLAIPHRVTDRMAAGLRQIFVTDPNNVVFELNFPVN